MNLDYIKNHVRTPNEIRRDLGGFMYDPEELEPDTGEENDFDLGDD